MFPLLIFILKVICEEFMSFLLILQATLFSHLGVENNFDEGSKNMALLQNMCICSQFNANLVKKC